MRERDSMTYDHGVFGFWFRDGFSPRAMGFCLFLLRLLSPFMHMKKDRTFSYYSLRMEIEVFFSLRT